MSAVEARKKRVVLITHEHQVPDLLDWATFNQDMLALCDIYATGATYHALIQTLGFDVKELVNGLLYNGLTEAIDLLIFLWDGAEPFPSDLPTTTLLDIAARQHVPIAANRAAAYAMFPACLEATNDQIEYPSQMSDR